MNILQSIQQLDGEILLQIQQHLRTDMLTPFMKIVTFLGNGGWFWIVLCVLLICFGLCGSLVPDLRGDRYQPASQKYSGKTKAFCGNRSSDPADRQTNGFLLSVRPHNSILCRCPGNASDAPEENWNPGSSPGSAGGIFQIVSWCPLSNRCPGRVRCCAGGKLAGCVGCEDEAGKSISLITDVEK